MSLKRKILASIITLSFISGCSLLAPALKYKLFDDFESQHQLMLYCENSEGHSGKIAGLMLIEIAASTQNIDLELNRGLCEKYYQRREPANAYIYMKNKANGN